MNSETKSNINATLMGGLLLAVAAWGGYKLYQASKKKSLSGPKKKRKR